MVRRGMGLALGFAIGCGGAAPAAQAPQATAGGPEQCSFASGTMPESAPDLLPWPSKTIPELKGVTGGGYNIEGFISEVFVPAACPAGQLCTDQPPHVVVNEKGEDEYVSPPRQLAIIVRDPKRLRDGGRYKMSIAVCGTRQIGATVNEAEMRAFVEIVK
jgi:hypothetical protein